MEITIKDEEFTLILSNEELSNDNFVDIVSYSDKAKEEGNETGFLCEGTVPIDELKSAVDAFYNLRTQVLEKELLLK